MLKSSHDVLDEKLNALHGLAAEKGITQDQVLEEMNDRERAVIEKLGGLPMLQAIMNLAGIPYGLDDSKHGNENQ